MAYYQWATDYTGTTKSFTYMLGRQSVDSPTSTIGLIVTLYNNNESTFPLTLNSTLTAQFSIGPSAYAQVSGRVASFEYDDEPNNGNNSTIVATCYNALGLMSLQQLTNASIAAGTTKAQVASLDSLVPLTINYLPGTGTSTYNMAAQTYTGSPTDYLRNLANAENAIIACNNYSEIGYISFQNGFVVSPCTIGRTTSTTQLGYQNLRRIRYRNPFYNEVTVTPSSGVAAQTASNASSVTTYGEKAYNLNTYYSTTAQALDAATWYANAFSDDGFRFEVDFLVDAQNQSVWTQEATVDTTGAGNSSAFASIVFANTPSYINVKYRAPGAVADTTVPCTNTGIRVNATPDGTYCTMYLTPISVFSQQFILNNAYFGILDTSRFGW